MVAGYQQWSNCTFCSAKAGFRRSRPSCYRVHKVPMWLCFSVWVMVACTKVDSDSSHLCQQADGCLAGEKKCFTNDSWKCVNKLDPRFGCGQTGCSPCPIKDATMSAQTACDKDGNCVIAGCTGDFADCDGIYENGCEKYVGSGACDAGL